MAKKKMNEVHAAAFKTIRTLALSYPETTEEFPWGDRVVKVRGKVFVFLGSGSEAFGLGVKLVASRDAALTLSFVEPMGYGLGKHGWVTARFPADEDIPVPMVVEWLEESFHAVAPSKVSRAMKEGGAPVPAKKPAEKKPATKKPVPKKPAAKKPPAKKPGPKRR